MAVSEKTERVMRAERLVEARKRAGFRGPKAIADKIGCNVNVYKAHESGRNGFGIADAKMYARAFGASLEWLSFGTGSIEDSFQKALAPNGLYIIGDGNGGATYKRFRPPNILEAVTTKPDQYPSMTFDSEPDVIGRVRKSILST